MGRSCVRTCLSLAVGGFNLLASALPAQAVDRHALGPGRPGGLHLPVLGLMVLDERPGRRPPGVGDEHESALVDQARQQFQQEGGVAALVEDV